MASAYKATPSGREPREGRQQGHMHRISGSATATNGLRREPDLTMGGRWFWDRGTALAHPPAPLTSVTFAVGDITVSLSFKELADLYTFATCEREAAAREAWNAERLIAKGVCP